VKKELKRRDIVSLFNALTEMGQPGNSYKKMFSYAVARNLGRLNSVHDAIAKSSAPEEAFVKGRSELLRQHAVVDDAGVPLEIPGMPGRVQVRDMEAFNTAVEQLRKDTGQDKKDQEIDELLEGTEEVDVYMVDFDHVPEPINPALFVAIEPMVREPVEDEESKPADASPTSS